MIESPLNAWDAARATRVLAVVAGTLAVLWIALRLPAALVIILPGCICVGLGILRWPWIAGLLLIASVPLQQAGAIGAGGASLTGTRVALAIAAAAVAVWWTVLRRDVVLAPSIVLWSAMLLALLASAFVARDQAKSAAEVTRWLIAFAAFAILLQFFGAGDRRRALWLATTVAGVVALEALYGIAQSVRAVGPESFLIGGGLTRAFGSFGRPNTFAGFLEFGPFLALSLALWFGGRAIAHLSAYRIDRLAGFGTSSTRRGSLTRAGVACLLLFGCAGAAFMGIVASFSRGAWLGVAAGGLAFALLLGPRVRLVTLATVPIVAALALSGIEDQFSGSLSERVGTISEVARPFDASSATITDDNFAAVERMAHWQAGWRMFEDHPFLGVGAGNFNVRYNDYYVREELRVSQGHAHNFYIHLLAEAGMIGLGVYLALLGFFMALALRVTFFSPPGLARCIALGCFATLLSVSVHNLFENLHVLNISIMYSAIWCLVITSHRMWRGTGTFASAQPGVDMEYSPA